MRVFLEIISYIFAFALLAAMIYIIILYLDIQEITDLIELFNWECYYE